MPFFDTYDNSFNQTAADSFNTDETNNATANLVVTDAGNTDNSVDGSFNLGVTITDSGNTDSHDTETYDQDETYTDSSTNDSYNTFTFTSTDDHSVQVGNRDYSTGFGDLTVGGGAAAAAGDGDTWIDGRSTILDQSVNQNIDGGHVFQSTSSTAVVGSGDDSIAAGGNVDITTTIDSSTTISSEYGDVNVGNETTIDNTVDSNNTYTDNSSYTDSSVEADIDDSWNDNSESYTADGSFNTTEDYTETTTITADVDAIVDSYGAAIDSDVAF
jgi:hypothetical protein